jgi:MerR family transcriptional regulator, light-induced transcriptional regulator
MEAAVRIGELARRTGVSPELLRAWEQRYDLLRPARSPGGFRLYAAADEARVRRMTAHIRRGLSAAEAARLAIGVDDGTVARVVAVTPLAELADQLRQSLDRFDNLGAQSVLDRLLATVSVDAVIGDVLIPYFRELGDRWARGDVTVAQEHFASNVIRGRLLGLGRDWGAGVGPTALLACVPGEDHDLGLVMFGILLSRRGWSVTFLGADTPYDTLHDGVRMLHPDVVVLTALDAEAFRAGVDDVRRLADVCPVVVAAPVPDDEIAATGARPAATDIVESARTLEV